MTPYQQLMVTPSDPWLDSTIAGIRLRLAQRRQQELERSRHAAFWAWVDAGRGVPPHWKELVHGQR